MTDFHNWTGDEEIDKQVPQFLNEDNAATKERLDTKFNKSLDIANASDLNNFMEEGFYCCNSNFYAETILNCPTKYAFGLMVWGKGTIVYQEVREYNRGSESQEYNNCWRRSYYTRKNVLSTWSKWRQMSYSATTLAGYGITDGMSKSAINSVSVADIMNRNINTSYLRLTGGDTFDKNATLQLCGGTYATNAGQFLLKAADSTHSAVLSGNPSGLLKWNDKNIVRSVNNSAADDDGNVTIDVNSVIVDTELSGTSTNPVQNKAIYSALLDKVGTDIFSGFALLGGDTNIMWREGTQYIGSINAVNYSGTARAATHDGEGNVITKTYAKKTDISGVVKSVNGTKPDTDGNVTIDISGVSTSESNTWSAQQNFHDLMLNREKYTTHVVNGTSDTPIISTMVYAVTGAFTLNLATLAGVLSASQSSVFTAYFAASADYALTITNAGTLKYVGSASDVAITSAGLLLNIWMSKDGGGTLTSIVQASKLS